MAGEEVLRARRPKRSARRRSVADWAIGLFALSIAWNIAGGAALAEGEPEESTGALRDEVTRGELPGERRRRIAAVDLAFGTHLPISIGGELTGTFYEHFLVSLHVGYLPDAYVSMINGIATGAGAYDDTVAGVVSAAANGSRVVRASVGARPFARSAFELQLGYTMISAGGDVAGREAIERATGADLAGYDTDGSVASRLHGIHASVGGRWVFREHLMFNLALGWFHTLRSRTQIGANGELPLDSQALLRVQSAVSEAENYLDRRVLQRWAFTPEFRMTLGYRF